MVKSIIHLMKRKTERALYLLSSIKTPSDLEKERKQVSDAQDKHSFDRQAKETNSDMSLLEFNDFWYMYYSNRAFAYILTNNFEKALVDL